MFDQKTEHCSIFENKTGRTIIIEHVRFSKRQKNEHRTTLFVRLFEKKIERTPALQ
jgi:hypothetical protein